MKNISHPVFMILVILGLSSCLSPVHNDGPKQPAKPNMTCKIDTLVWSAPASARIDYGVVTIKGVRLADGQTISLTINGINESEYTLQQGGYSVAAYTPNSEPRTEAYISGSPGPATGVLTIGFFNRHDKTISGTFNFTGLRASDQSKKSITGGVFTDVPISGALPPTAGSLSAKINGTSWSSSQAFDNIVSGTSLVVQATGSGERRFYFTLPADIRPGTYTLTRNGNYSVVFSNAGAVYSSQSGTIHIISRTTNEMAADFSFKGVNTANSADMADIASGSFEVLF